MKSIQTHLRPSIRRLGSTRLREKTGGQHPSARARRSRRPIAQAGDFLRCDLNDLRDVEDIVAIWFAGSKRYKLATLCV